MRWRALLVMHRGAVMPELPRVTFGVIVLNGEPFTRYCLRALYPFAHEIIVVEGAHENATAVATPDGHSTDGTLDVLMDFKANEDPDDKVTIVVRDGFWPMRDELGRCRTPQSRAYAERATGDYLWQVDIDEFYLPEDMQAVMEMLVENPDVATVTFYALTFWGSPRYVVDSMLRPRATSLYNRLFRWGDGFKYVTHEPPTVVDSRGRDLRSLCWVKRPRCQGREVRLFHYCLLLPKQVLEKAAVYAEEKPDSCASMVKWAEESYLKLRHPYHVFHSRNSLSWLDRYSGEHPPQVLAMMRDIADGRHAASLRGCEDVETLLGLWWYPVGRGALKASTRLLRAAGSARSAAARIAHAVQYGLGGGRS